MSIYLFALVSEVSIASFRCCPKPTPTTIIPIPVYSVMKFGDIHSAPKASAADEFPLLNLDVFCAILIEGSPFTLLNYIDCV
jgi:hypothetical protein